MAETYLDLTMSRNHFQLSRDLEVQVQDFDSEVAAWPVSDFDPDVLEH